MNARLGPALKLAPPVAAFLLARAVLWAVASAGGFDYFDASIWARWDSDHYLSVAEKGYELVPCAAIGYPTGEWCGNTGWFPGYPFAIALLARLGPPGAAAGAILSAGFHLATLLLLWIGFLGARWSLPNVLGLLMAAFFPGQIYHHAVFPVSVFTFFALLFLCLIAKEHWAGAGIAGAAASFTYPTGVLLAPIAALTIFVAYPGIFSRQNLTRIVAAAGPVLLGFVAVLLLHQLSAGAWDAFFKVQAKYGHGPHNPVTTFLSAVRGGRVPGLQTAFVGLTAVLFVVGAWLRRRRPDLPAVLFAVLFWLFPLTVGRGVSLYRSEALLLPSVLLLRNLPVGLQAAIVAGAALLAIPMALLFFRSVLI